ncbi:hypothetical protein AQZ52_09855 [Novosphingobium fuchskuhlense]|uniref:Uncharacterized protein n=1 Tax=Novosphingobium fuchskuhlense TaxID=1117702 RepID=A0A117UUD7_9SPHN|nr:hypothetical protein [Novosphingobium fuchskuhlense]KUR71003.1 hypothetical protein AQZ52_09855 [Novosphingobium fuchskuhlense]
MAESEIEIALSARDASHALEASARMPPDVRVRVSIDRVFMSAATSVTDARHLWRVALLNERLVAEADPARTDLLMMLIT